jgi:ElaB/YqjD/DUF883 family membrane-anchored ribosome-binding protein
MAENLETVIGEEAIMSDQPSSSTPGSAGLKGTIKQKIGEHGGELKERAQAKAYDFANQGKDKATDALDGVSRFIEDTAATLDAQIGGGVGDYVRRAGGAISGFTDSLKSKDVQELFSDAQDAVRRNPAIAIGAAAAAGFVLMRLIKAAGGDAETVTGSADTASSTKS